MSTLRGHPVLTGALLVLSAGWAYSVPSEGPLTFPSRPVRLAGVFQAELPARILATFPDENLVRVLDDQGTILEEFARVARPLGIAAGLRRIYVASGVHGSVEVFELNSGLAEPGRLFRRSREAVPHGSGLFGAGLGALGSGRGEFEEPVAVALSPLNGDIVVADSGRREVRVFDPRTLQQKNVVGKDVLRGPSGMAFSADGTLYVADMMGAVVRKFHPDYSFERSFTRRGADPGETMRPVGVALDSTGRILVVDAFHGRVQVYTADGRLVAEVGAVGEGPGLMRTPIDALVRPADGWILVTDSGESQLEFFPKVP